MKYCPNCKQDKDDGEFHHEAKRFDGLASNCKDCKNARNRANWKENYYPANREKLIQNVIERRKFKKSS